MKAAIRIVAAPARSRRARPAPLRSPSPPPEPPVGPSVPALGSPALDDAACTPPLARDPLDDPPMGGLLGRVVERRQRLDDASAAQRGRDQPVGQPGVLRQDRAVQVGAVDLPVDGTLLAIAAVVAAAADLAERPAAGAEVGLAGVILEADQRPGAPVLEPAGHDLVADHAPRPRDGV